MDPATQPGSLGFAYVHISSGSIIPDDLVIRAGIVSATRIGTGEFEIDIQGIDGPWGISIQESAGFTLKRKLVWTGSQWFGVTINFYDDSNDPADPDWFVINILPT